MLLTVVELDIKVALSLIGLSLVIIGKGVVLVTWLIRLQGKTIQNENDIKYLKEITDKHISTNEIHFHHKIASIADENKDLKLENAHSRIDGIVKEVNELRKHQVV